MDLVFGFVLAYRRRSNILPSSKCMPQIIKSMLSSSSNWALVMEEQKVKANSDANASDII